MAENLDLAMRVSVDGAPQSAQQIEGLIKKLESAEQAASQIGAGGTDGLNRLGAASKKAEGQFSGLEGKTRNAKGQFVSLGNAAGKSGDQVSGFGGKLEQFQANMDKAALSTLALSQAADQLGALGDNVNALSGAALAAATEFDSARAKVSTLTDDTDGLTAALRDVGAGLEGQANTTELLAASYDVLSAGFTDTADAAKVVEAANVAAVGGFSTTATTVDALTSVLNAYGLSADQAAALSDKFIATQNAGKITVDQYAQQIGKVAPLAAQAGVGIDELNGFIAQATVQGVAVESTFSGLRAALAATLKPSSEASALAEKLGISFDAATLRTKGLSGILAELNAKGLDTPEILTQLFGSVEAVAAIAPSAGENFAEFQDKVSQSANSLGAADKAFSKVANSFDGKTKAAFNELNEALVGLGQGVILAVKPLIEALTFLLNNFNKLPGPVKQVIGVIVGLTGGAISLGAAILTVAAILPVVNAGMATLGIGGAAAAAGTTAAGAAAATATPLFAGAGAAASTFAASLLALAPALALVAAAAALAILVKTTNELRNTNEAVTSLAEGTKTLSNQSLSLAGKLNALNQAEKANGDLTEEQEKRRQGLIKLSKDQIGANDEQIASLEEQAKAIEGSGSAADAQRQAIATQINELKKMNGTLNKQIGTQGGANDATREGADALKEQGDAAKEAEAKVKELEASLKEQQAAVKESRQEAFQLSQSDNREAFSDRQQNAQEAFQQGQNDAQEAFNAEQQAKAETFQAAQQARESAFNEAQQAAQDAFNKAQDAQRDGFAASEEAIRADALAQRQAAEDAFRQQQEAAADAFAKAQQAKEQAFNEAQQAKKDAANAKFNALEEEVNRRIQLENTASAQERLALEQKFREEDAARQVEQAQRQRVEAQVLADPAANAAAQAAGQQQASPLDEARAAFEEQLRAEDQAFREQQRAEEQAFQLTQQEAQAAKQAELDAQQAEREAAADARREAFELQLQEAKQSFEQQQQAEAQAFAASQKDEQKAFDAEQRAEQKAFDAGQRAEQKAFDAEQRAEQKAFDAEQRAAEKAFKQEIQALEKQQAKELADALQAAAANLRNATQNPANSTPPVESPAPRPTPRRSGGPVSANQPYLVGEEGPELIMPRRDGFVLTAAQTAAVMSTPTLPTLGRDGSVFGNDGIKAVAQEIVREVRGLRRDINARPSPTQQNTFNLATDNPMSEVVDISQQLLAAQIRRGGLG